MATRSAAALNFSISTTSRLPTSGTVSVLRRKSYQKQKLLNLSRLSRRTLALPFSCRRWPSFAIRATCRRCEPHVLQAAKSLFLKKGPRWVRHRRPTRQRVRVAGEVLMGDRVLVATGAWTDRLLAPLGVHLKIEPVRGQIALLNPGRVVFHRILLWGSRYLVPRLDGRVLIGSTEEHAGFEKVTTAEGIEGLLALGLKLVPALAHAALERTWAGLRPGSPDGAPFIGLVPGVDNLFVAAGHFRGIQLSPERRYCQGIDVETTATMPIDAFRLIDDRAVPL